MFDSRGSIYRLAFVERIKVVNIIEIKAITIILVFISNTGF